MLGALTLTHRTQQEEATVSVAATVCVNTASEDRAVVISDGLK